LPGDKGEQSLLVTESNGFTAGVGRYAIHIEVRSRPEELAPVTLPDKSEGEVQAGYGISPLDGTKG